MNPKHIPFLPAFLVRMILNCHSSLSLPIVPFNRPPVISTQWKDTPPMVIHLPLLFTHSQVLCPCLVPPLQADYRLSLSWKVRSHPSTIESHQALSSLSRNPKHLKYSPVPNSTLYDSEYNKSRQKRNSRQHSILEIEPNSTSTLPTTSTISITTSHSYIPPPSILPKWNPHSSYRCSQ